MADAKNVVITATVRQVAALVLVKGWRLATAESCTGGGISHAITTMAGSSQWFAGGVISYANDVKEKLLKVPQTMLLQHGAVSKPVARAMAQGVRTLLNTDIAVAVTGIVGPDGGSAEKPVGTVWIAWSVAAGTTARRFQFRGDRDQIRQLAVEQALQGVVDLLG